VDLEKIPVKENEVMKDLIIVSLKNNGAGDEH